MFHASVVKTPHGIMAFVSDEELVGKAFYDDENQKILMIPEKLYGGDLIDEKEAINILSIADVLVLTGERIVSIAIKLGLAHPDSILYVKGIPHVHVYKMTGPF